MKKFTSILAVFLFAAFFTGCEKVEKPQTPPDEKPEVQPGNIDWFLQKVDPGVYRKDSTVYHFEEFEDQLSITNRYPGKVDVRFLNTHKEFAYSFEDIPEYSKKDSVFTLKYVRYNSIYGKKVIDTKVSIVEMKDGKAWMYSENRKEGIIIYFE